MNADKLEQLAQLLEEFRDFVDTRDSQAIANARTTFFANRLLQQHMENRQHLLLVLNWARNMHLQFTLCQ